MGSGMPASVTFLLGVWKWVQASYYWNGENIATVEAEAVLLSSLSWKRFPSLVALLDGLKACFAAESLLHGSSERRMPLAIAAAWETNLWPMEHSTLQWFKEELRNDWFH